jgi:hypothetical protein
MKKLLLEVTFKPDSRIGTGIISSNSKRVFDITAKKQIWSKYGDQEIANLWAKSVLYQTIKEPCTLIEAIVYEEDL